MKAFFERGESTWGRRPGVSHGRIDATVHQARVDTEVRPTIVVTASEARDAKEQWNEW